LVDIVVLVVSVLAGSNTDGYRNAGDGDDDGDDTVSGGAVVVGTAHGERNSGETNSSGCDHRVNNARGRDMHHFPLDSPPKYANARTSDEVTDNYIFFSVCSLVTTRSHTICTH